MTRTICTHRTHRTFLAGLALLALLPACGEGQADELLAFDEVAADAPDEAFADDTDAEDGLALETSLRAIRGFVAANPLRGIIKVAVAGQADVHTGLQLRPDMVVTSNAFIGHATAPASVTLTAAPGTASAQTATARGVNASDYFPAAILHHDDFSAANSFAYSIDRRTSAQLVNEVVRCYEYVGNRLNYADMRITAAVAGGALTVQSAFLTGDTIEPGDAGAPCLDLDTWTAVGMVSSNGAGGLRLDRYAPMEVWFDGQRNVAGARDDVRNARLSLYTLAPNGQAMCLDIPFGSPYSGELPTVYPCHYGPAQRFWLDMRVDANRPQLVSDASGLCLDVPNASTAGGVNYQQYGCHTGFNQRFELTLWNDAAGGWKLRPAHATPQNLCLSVEGGPSAVSHAVEQRVCTGAADQRWLPRWAP